MSYIIKGMKTLFSHIYSIALSLWVGGIFLFTFIVTPVIFRSYPQDLSGDIVGRLFPSYFLYCLSAATVSLGALLLSPQDRAAFGYRPSLVLLSLAVVISLYANFGLYPEIRRVKQEVHSFEASSPDDPARRRFRALHAVSAVLNLVMLADGVTLIILGANLKKTLS